MGQTTTPETVYGRFILGSTQLNVEFSFTCRCFIDQSILMANQESDAEPMYTGRFFQQPIPSIGISINRNKIEISNTADQLIEEFRRTANTAFMHWPINAEGQTYVIESAVDHLISALRSRPLSSNNDYDKIWIHCPVTITLNHFVEEGREDMDLALLQSSQEAEAHMVPAAEFSIESSLKEAAVANDSEETCTICLEVIRGKATRMPCSHLFHGCCIQKWLGTSHYCPLCRFKLPTEI
ncbi:probable E3 ubiquitin-protein ligase RHY1A [Andrographis paniculata]|uniref:probable E3 ubiquitin-protein ligase RHY1A n=1 Tax=Andrographis paniculata TaxID=175694 RepID=UPI0021E7615D|nr:probable E3 ubiquitin-protein ligase RHY1A [Andrographis paniculata]